MAQNPPKTPSAYLSEILTNRAAQVPRRTLASVRSQFARQIDINPRTLERYLAGMIDMRASAVFALIQALHLSADELNELRVLYKEQMSQKLLGNNPRPKTQKRHG